MSAGKMTRACVLMVVFCCVLMIAIRNYPAAWFSSVAALLVWMRMNDAGALNEALKERDHLHGLLTRIAYKLKDLPPNIEPLGWGLHEELWTAVSKPPNASGQSREPGAGHE